MACALVLIHGGGKEFVARINAALPEGTVPAFYPECEPRSWTVLYSLGQPRSVYSIGFTFVMKGVPFPNAHGQIVQQDEEETEAAFALRCAGCLIAGTPAIERDNAVARYAFRHFDSKLLGLSVRHVPGNNHQSFIELLTKDKERYSDAVARPVTIQSLLPLRQEMFGDMSLAAIKLDAFMAAATVPFAVLYEEARFKVMLMRPIDDFLIMTPDTDVPGVLAAHTLQCLPVMSSKS